MIRQLHNKADFKEVCEYSEQRVDINFDVVPLTDEEGKETDYAYWSRHSYFSRPTTEQMQGDVIKYTIQRYENEGLEPPRPEDIDVSKYVIED